jgi:type IV secretory pathway VirJ component
MQCLGCRADNQMRLMDVVRDDTIKVPVIEHHTYMCSACRHIARRLVFRRAKTPITHLPVITTPIDKLWKGRVAAPRAWGNAVEKLRSRQTDLKQRGAAAKITAWTKAAEKVRSKQAALAEQAAGASRPQEP